MKEGGPEAGAHSGEREAEPGRSLGPSRPLPRPGSPLSPRVRSAPRPSAGRKARPDWLRLGEAGFGRARSRYWLTGQDSAQSTRSLPSPGPRRRPFPARSRGGGRRRLLVTLATVGGPRRLGNGPRPPVSLRLGPSGRPDNHYPFRSTVSPFPVALATAASPAARWTHGPQAARGPPRPRPPPSRSSEAPAPAAHLSAPRGHCSRPCRARGMGWALGVLAWVGLTYRPALRLCAAPSWPVSPLALLRGTVQPPQGTFQNTNHVPPLLKSTPFRPPHPTPLPLRIESKLLSPWRSGVASSPACLLPRSALVATNPRVVTPVA